MGHTCLIRGCLVVRVFYGKMLKNVSSLFLVFLKLVLVGSYVFFIKEGVYFTLNAFVIGFYGVFVVKNGEFCGLGFWGCPLVY